MIPKCLERELEELEIGGWIDIIKLEISLKAEKSSENQRRLAVTQTPGKDQN